MPRLLVEFDGFFDFPVDFPEVLPLGAEPDDPLDDGLEPGAEEEDGDDDEASGACGCCGWVIWMFRWPSLESALPSLATKLKVSTSTPAGA